MKAAGPIPVGPAETMRRCSTILALALACLTCDTTPSGTASDELEPDQPCVGHADCPDGAFCVADPCPDQMDPNDPAHDGCGVFTCRLECASGVPGQGGPSNAALLCADSLDCCSERDECVAELCVER